MNFFKKFLQFGMGNIIVLIIGFISSPFITRIIEPTEMGKFSMFSTITSLLLLVVLIGIDQAYVRYYYEEKEENRGLLLRTCIKIPLIINIFLSILILLFYKKISIYIVEEQSLFLAILIIIHVTASIFSRFSLLQIRMKQKAKLYSLLNVLMKLFYLLFVLIFFFIYKNNYMVLVISTIISNIIVGLLGIIYEKDEWVNEKDFTKIKTDKNELIKYGVPFIFSMAITWVFQSIDRIAIKEFCGYREVGVYSGAMTIIALLNACQGAFTTFWAPVAYEKYTNNPKNKEFFEVANKLVVVTMLLIAIVLITAKDILVLLLGQEYREAVYIFPYLVFMPIMYTISETTVLGINFKKQTKKHINIAIISALCNIIGNIILVPLYGSKGSAISTGLSYIVFFAIRTYISNKYYKINYSLKKFTLVTSFTYILAFYSSFYKFNFVIFCLALICIFSIIIFYRDVFIMGYNLLKSKNFK